MEGVESFCSPFLGAFEILPWTHFDDGACGSVFRVNGKGGVACPVGGVDVSGFQFVVKIVSLSSSDRGESEEVKELREVELLEEIKDENVVRVFGSWEERPPLGFEYPNRPPVNQRGARLLFILMEYCDLFTLRRWLGWPQEKRSWTDLLNIFLQVTKGLVAIHTQGIIHRDLKPSNVGLTCHSTEERVVAKLIDFGLATTVRDEMTSQVGTFIYRSPESHQNQRGYDEKTDIYALGIMLCQMITSLAVVDMSLSRLEGEFREFVEAKNSSAPLPFDALSYLDKYGVTQQNLQMSQMIQLAQQMTSYDPTERPSSLEVLERMRQLNPGVEDSVVSIYNYLEEVKEQQVCHSYKNCTDFRPIKTSRLIHLTHLTLRNIQLTKQQLFETLKDCFVLKHLSMSLVISDFRDDELLPLDSIRLPSLKTFRLRVHNLSGETNNVDPENPVKRYGVPRIQSLMFFGPLSQIWEKQMRVKVSCGKQILLSINAGQTPFFYLNRIEGGFQFLEILNQVEFQDVSLRWLSGKNDGDKLDLEKNWMCEKKAEVRELEVVLPWIDLMEGNLFQGFSCLAELSVKSRAGLPYNKISIRLLPSTISRLFLQWIQVSVQGMSETSLRTLSILSLADCEVPAEFYEQYSAIFEVECLFVSSVRLGSKVSVVPGLSFVESVFNTSNWRSVNLDPFDWMETPENSHFRTELISSFFSSVDEEYLRDREGGMLLELIEGNAVARVIEGVQSNPYALRKSWSQLVSPTDPVDSDDEQPDLIVQQGLYEIVERFGSLKNIVRLSVDPLETDLTDKFVFKGVLSHPTYPQDGWESTVTFQKFLGISKDKPKLRHIRLEDCSVSFSLPIQLRGCVGLESLVLDMVEWKSDSRTHMTSSFPVLKTYDVNLYSRFLPEGIHADYFTLERFDQLWFFRSGPQRIKGLWGQGIECHVSVQGTLYFQLDESSLALQFLPDVDRILSLLELNETLKTLRIQCCLFKLSCGSLPSSITKLTLRYVEATFREVCDSELTSLVTLVFEGRGDHIFVDAECIETLPFLKHLTLCNVGLCGLLNKVRTPLESLTLSRVKQDVFCDVGWSFNDRFTSLLNTESLILADGVNHSFNWETLYSLLTSEDVCMSSVVFIHCERSMLNPEVSEEEFRRHSVCESFLRKHEIIGNSFSVQLKEKSSKEWGAVDILPDGKDDELLEGYLETKPYFGKNDKPRRTENLKRLRDRQFLPEGHFSV